MSKGIGEKLLGLFIEEEAECTARPEGTAGPERDPAEEPAKTRPPARPAAAPPVVAPGAVHDGGSFAAVYRRAGLPEADRDRLGKAIGLVETLPSEATPEVKRAIVRASLEAFGVPIEAVVATGNGAIAALDAYAVEGQRRNQEVLADAAQRIAKLEAEIDEVRRLMAVQAEAQQELVRATANERARVRVALDFFEGAGAAAPGVPRLRRIS